MIEDYGLKSPARALLLLVLSVKDKNQEKGMDKLHIQKIIRYFEYLRQKNEVDFSNFKFGGVSYELEENLEAFYQDYGLVDTKDGNFVLTKLGEMAIRDLKKNLSNEEYRQLVFAKEQLNDLPFGELLYFMYNLIPETQKHSTEFERLDKNKKLLVKNLFLKGKISACIAAKWLETNEKEFLTSPRKKENL
jgi:hypothetical protein